MASNRIAGTCYFQIDGQQYETTGTVSWMGSQTKREGIPSNDLSVPGYKESPLVPYIEGDFVMTDELNSQVLAAVDGAVVTVEAANSTVFTLMNAWCCGELKVDTTEGKVTCKFEGTSSLEE